MDTDRFIGIGIQATNKDLTIGNSFDDITNLPFSGKIDDVRIYNRVLSESEIQDLYDENIMMKIL